MKSGSVSFGTRGFHYTVGTQGQRVTVGIPGTGLFWTKKIDSSSPGAPPVQPHNPVQTNFPTQPALPHNPAICIPKSA
jgi:Protein of unknown function (DUF4236)